MKHETKREMYNVARGYEINRDTVRQRGLIYRRSRMG